MHQPEVYPAARKGDGSVRLFVGKHRGELCTENVTEHAAENPRHHADQHAHNQGVAQPVARRAAADGKEGEPDGIGPEENAPLPKALHAAHDDGGQNGESERHPDPLRVREPVKRPQIQKNVADDAAAESGGKDAHKNADGINAAAGRGEKSGDGKSEHADAVGNFCNDGEGLHHGGVSIVIPS